MVFDLLPLCLLTHFSEVCEYSVCVQQGFTKSGKRRSPSLATSKLLPRHAHSPKYNLRKNQILGEFKVKFKDPKYSSRSFLEPSAIDVYQKKNMSKQLSREGTGLPRVREMSGKNEIFSRSGKSQGILKKCQGILAI